MVPLSFNHQILDVSSQMDISFLPIVDLMDWRPVWSPCTKLWVADPKQIRPATPITAAPATRMILLLPCFRRRPCWIVRRGPVGGPYSRPYCIITCRRCRLLEWDGESSEAGTFWCWHFKLSKSHAWFNSSGPLSMHRYWADSGLFKFVLYLDSSLPAP